MCFLRPGDKYGIVAVENTKLAGDLHLPIRISNALEIQSALPIDVEEHWTEWLGTLTIESLTKSNLVIVARKVAEDIRVVNHENKELRESSRAVWYGLLLNGIPYSDNVHFLSGSIYTDRPPDVRQHTDEDFHRSHGRRGVEVTESNLRTAPTLAEGILAMRPRPRPAAQGESSRPWRGFHALIGAITAVWGEDRLHRFVRAVEGIVDSPPPSGRNFLERVISAMVDDDPDNRLIIDDIYKLRNAIEHLNPLRDIPDRIVDADERNERRNRLVRQAEDLALRVYRRLTSDRALIAELSTDAGIDALWSLDAAGRRRRWADSINLNSIP